jgi:predicted permease
LFLHTLYDAARTPPGFSSDHILAFDLAPVRAEYPDVSSVDALSQRIVRQLEAIPGVTSAVVTTNLPAGSRVDEQFNIGIHAPGGESSGRQFRGIGTGFFKLFDISVLRGRTFTRDDLRGGEQVAVVNQALADRLYGGHALGQLIQNGSGADLWSARIVGVVGNTRQFGSFIPAPGIVYVPLAQMRDDIMQVFRGFDPMRFALHVQGDPDSYRNAVQKAVTLVAPDQPIANLRSMNDVLRNTTAQLRMNLLLVGIFAALALLLAAAGMYAVMAVAVAAREREFGVRMALGAAPAKLLALVLRNGLVQIGVGLLLGVVLSLSLTGVLRAVMEQLDSTRSFDPFAIAGVCLMLALAGLLACLLPALRAARVAPMHALRGE